MGVCVWVCAFRKKSKDKISKKKTTEQVGSCTQVGPLVLSYVFSFFVKKTCDPAKFHDGVLQQYVQQPAADLSFNFLYQKCLILPICWLFFSGRDN